MRFPRINRLSERSTAARYGPWLLALGLFLVYCADSVSRYYRASPGSYDLGIFTEAIKQYGIDAEAPMPTTV